MKSLELYAQSLADYFDQKENCIHFMIRDDGARYPVQPAIFFRDEQDLFEVERPILNEARGRVLVVGAGAGAHVLPLQERHLTVDALELSPLLCRVMKDRGVIHILPADIRTFNSEITYDSVILPGRNIGIAGTLKILPPLLKKLLTLLSPGGQILLDSWNFMSTASAQDKVYVENKIKNKQYPGEVSFRVEYQGQTGDPFEWLYVNYSTLEKLCAKLNLPLERLAEDEQGNYLARINAPKEESYHVS